MGFPGYFLIVADFINWAKQHGIPVGPGRGSGAGSLVAWALKITDLDPLQFDLLFERFLNPERVSMPDFDIDFCMDRRDEVDRLRRAQVRPRQSQPDHHLRLDGGQGRAARFRSRAEHGLWPGRQAGQEDDPAAAARPDPVRRAGPVGEIEEGDRPRRQGVLRNLRAGRGRPRPDRPGAEPGKPHPQRRQARRRRGDRADPADRFRPAVLRSRRRRRGHPVRQGRRGSGRSGQVRLPRPAHADHHRLGGEGDQRAPRRYRRAGAGHRQAAAGRPGAVRTAEEGADGGGVPARILRHAAHAEGRQARPLRGHHRAGGAVQPARWT
ncbi:Error-prone DNA polymerase [Rhodanobacter lindaniclasticus]